MEKQEETNEVNFHHSQERQHLKRIFQMFNSIFSRRNNKNPSTQAPLIQLTEESIQRLTCSGVHALLEQKKAALPWWNQCNNSNRFLENIAFESLHWKRDSSLLLCIQTLSEVSIILKTASNIILLTTIRILLSSIILNILKKLPIYVIKQILVGLHSAKIKKKRIKILICLPYPMLLHHRASHNPSPQV